MNWNGSVLLNAKPAAAVCTFIYFCLLSWAASAISNSKTTPILNQPCVFLLPAVLVNGNNTSIPRKQVLRAKRKEKKLMYSSHDRVNDICMVTFSADVLICGLPWSANELDARLSFLGACELKWDKYPARSRELVPNFKRFAFNYSTG